jgi:hypothetical protein
MAYNYKPPYRRTTVILNGLLGWEAASDKEANNKEDIVYITN